MSYQENDEVYYQRPDVQLISTQITPEKQTVELNLEPFQGVTINQISMSSNNFSNSTHIVELHYGPQFEIKSVVARLTGQVYESQQVNLTIPAQPIEQNICFLLIGNDDKIGSVDVICSLFVDEEMYEQMHEHGEEEFEEEEREISEENQNDKQESSSEDKDTIQMFEKMNQNIENQKQDKSNEKKEQNNKQQVQQQKQEQQPMKEESTKQQKQQQQQNQQQTNKWRLYKGMKILDKVLGKGEPCKVGQTVSMKYVLHLNDENGKIIDQSGRKPFTFKLGRGDVIRGWELGIPGMKIGGKRQLIIPPQLGYGSQGTDGIPPRTNLFFEVELVNKRD